MSLVPPELEAAARPIGLRIESVLHRTGKVLLASGEFGETRAAVKFLLAADPFWASRWRHELTVYQAFAETPPPIRAPRLLYTDRRRLMILEWLDGDRLHDDRYPPVELPAERIEAVLSTIRTLNTWHPVGNRFERIFDYPDRFRRYHARGYLTGADLDALVQLLGRCGRYDQFNHGDPLPGNVLILADGTATMLDWEFTGWFLPGFDLAMLHTLLGAAHPVVAGRVELIVADTGIGCPFAINLAAVLTRELRIHHELPDGPIRHTRLALVEAAWTQARERIHRLARGGS